MNRMISRDKNEAIGQKIFISLQIGTKAFIRTLYKSSRKVIKLIYWSGVPTIIELHPFKDLGTR